jgi:hypothetical protein
VALVRERTIPTKGILAPAIIYYCGKHEKSKVIPGTGHGGL